MSASCPRHQRPWAASALFSSLLTLPGYSSGSTVCPGTRSTESRTSGRRWHRQRLEDSCYNPELQAIRGLGVRRQVFAHTTSDETVRKTPATPQLELGDL